MKRTVLKKKMRRADKVKGQGMLEFAIALPILLALLFGIFEAARAMWVIQAVNTASREAIRYGSSTGDNGAGTPRYLDCAGIRAVARGHGWPGAVANADITITYDGGPGTASIGACPVDCPPTCTSRPTNVDTGDRIIVEVLGHFTPAGYLPGTGIPSFDIPSENKRSLVDEVLLDP